MFTLSVHRCLRQVLVHVGALLFCGLLHYSSIICVHLPGQDLDRYDGWLILKFNNVNYLGLRFLRALRLMTFPDILQYLNILKTSTSIRCLTFYNVMIECGLKFSCHIVILSRLHFSCAVCTRCFFSMSGLSLEILQWGGLRLVLPACSTCMVLILLLGNTKSA